MDMTDPPSVAEEREFNLTAEDREDLSIDFISLSIQEDMEPSIVRSAVPESSIRNLSISECQQVVKALMKENQQLKETVMEGNSIQNQQREMIEHLKTVNENLKEDVTKKMDKAKKLVDSLMSKRNEKPVEEEQTDSASSLDKSQDSEPFKSSGEGTPRPNNLLILQNELLRSQLKDMEEQRDMILKRQAASDIASAESEERALKLKQEIQKLKQEKADMLTINTELMSRIEEQTREESFMVISENHLPSISAIAVKAETAAESAPVISPKPSVESADQYKELQEEIAMLRTEKSNAESEIQKMQNENRDQKSELTTLKETRQALERDLIQIRQRNDGQESEIKQLRSKLRDSENEQIAVRSKCCDLENQVRDMRAHVDHLQSMLADANSKVREEKPEESLGTLMQQELQQLRDWATKEEGAANKSSDKITALEIELEDCKTNYDKLLAEYESLVAKWRTAQEKAQYVSQMEQQLDESNKLVDEYLTDIRILTIKTETVDEKDRQIKEYQNQIEDYLEDIRLLTEKVGKQHENRTTRDAEIRHLRQSLEDSRNEARAFQQQASTIGDELQKSLQELEDWRAGNRGMSGATGGTLPSQKIKCPLCEEEFEDHKKATEHVNWYCKQK